MPNTIKLKKYSDNIFEKAAAAAITPGMLVEPTAADKVQAHSTAEGDAIPMFALEDELQGNGIDDAYSTDNQVQVWIPARGDEVYALLADGENVSIGTFLASNGDGYLRQHDLSSGGAEYPLQIVAQALEAVDYSGSSGADNGYRIKVRIV